MSGLGCLAFQNRKISVWLLDVHNHAHQQVRKSVLQVQHAIIVLDSGPNDLESSRRVGRWSVVVAEELNDTSQQVEQDSKLQRMQRVMIHRKAAYVWDGEEHVRAKTSSLFIFRRTQRPFGLVGKVSKESPSDCQRGVAISAHIMRLPMR